MPKNPIKQKDAYDKFYTKPEIADWCIGKLLSLCDLSGKTVIEPSAGNGAFSSKLKCIAYDIKPEGEGIIEADFLSINVPGADAVYIGNPPFGSRNALSKSFIKKCSQNGKVIAFVLPECYDKFSMQKVFGSDWSLIFSEKLPDNSFVFEGKGYNVPCVFQVWERDSIRIDLREKKQLTYNEHFEILSSTKKCSADWFVFGAALHKVILPQDVTDKNRGHYIKCNIDKESVRTNLQSVDWGSYGKSSVSGGVSWFTKDEFIKQYNFIFNIK